MYPTKSNHKYQLSLTVMESNSASISTYKELFESKGDGYAKELLHKLIERVEKPIKLSESEFSFPYNSASGGINYTFFKEAKTMLQNGSYYFARLPKSPGNEMMRFWSLNRITFRIQGTGNDIITKESERYITYSGTLKFKRPINITLYNQTEELKHSSTAGLVNELNKTITEFFKSPMYEKYLQILSKNIDKVDQFIKTHVFADYAQDIAKYKLTSSSYRLSRSSRGGMKPIPNKQLEKLLKALYKADASNTKLRNLIMSAYLFEEYSIYDILSDKFAEMSKDAFETVEEMIETNQYWSVEELKNTYVPYSQITSIPFGYSFYVYKGQLRIEETMMVEYELKVSKTDKTNAFLIIDKQLGATVFQSQTISEKELDDLNYEHNTLKTMTKHGKTIWSRLIRSNFIVAEPFNNHKMVEYISTAADIAKQIATNSNSRFSVHVTARNWDASSAQSPFNAIYMINSSISMLRFVKFNAAFNLKFGMKHVVNVLGYIPKTKNNARTMYLSVLDDADMIDNLSEYSKVLASDEEDDNMAANDKVLEDDVDF